MRSFNVPRLAAVLWAAVLVWASGTAWAAPPNNIIPGVATSNGDVLLCSGTPWIDVRCNGADPTDTSDSTTAIQTTITQALAGHYPIKFSAGKYKANSTLTIDTTGLPTAGLKIISDNATIDGTSVASGPTLLVQRSGGTTGSPAVDQNFTIDGGLTVLGSDAAYTCQIGKNDFSDEFKNLRLGHLVCSNASSAAGGGGIKINFIEAGDLWLSGTAAGSGTAAVALEQVQDSRIAGAGAASGTSAASLLLENGASEGNTVAGFSYGSVSNTCLSITSSTATPNVFVQPNGGCTTGINFSQTGLSETLIGMNFTGTNVGPVSSGAIVLGRGLGAYTAPAASSYTALCSDDGKVISSANATGAAAGWAAASLPVTLPSAAACGAHWRMSFVTDGGKAVVLTPAGGQHILAGTRTLSAMTLGPGNYEFVTIRSDGANMRVAASSPGSLVINGAALPGVPANWEYPGGPGYQATQGDAAAEISSALASGGLTVTLPSTTAIASGWTIGLSPDAEPLTVQVNGTSGGNMLYANGVPLVSPQTLSGLTWVQFDGANFRVLGPVTRTMLLAGTSIYVTPTGQDVGRCDAASKPCLTLQYACNQAMNNYDLHGNSIYIQVADGTYHAGCSIVGPLVGGVAAQGPVINIVGDDANPDNVEIDNAAAPGPQVFFFSNGAIGVLQGMRIDSATGSATYTEFGAELAMTDVDFGNTALGQIHTETAGVTNIFGDYSISGSGRSHIQNVLGGHTRFSEIPITVTLNGTLNFPGGFISLDENSTSYMVPCLGGVGCPDSSGIGVTFAGTGTVVGPRYQIANSSTLEAENGNMAFFPPGSSPGTATGNATYSPNDLVPTRHAVLPTGATLWVDGNLGSDANNTCSYESLPCQTITYACSLASTYDLGNDAALVIEVAAGTYTSGCSISGPSRGSQYTFSSPSTRSLPITIEGPFTGAPAIVNDTSGAVAAFQFGDDVEVQVLNFTIGSTAGAGILSQWGAQVIQYNNNFTTCALAHMEALDKGTITAAGNYAISGGAPQHLLGLRGGEFTWMMGITVTLTGTPAWSLAGVVLQDLSVANIPSSGVTFVGAATGLRYSVTSNSVLDTGNPAGTPSTFLPGSTTGTTTTGGQAL